MRANIDVYPFWVLVSLFLTASFLFQSCARGRPYIKPVSKPRVIEIPPPPRAPTMRPYIINGKRYYPIPRPYGYVEFGKASWYGKRFHGRRTASGEPYNMYDFTAAHRTLPMNTYVRVVNLNNNRSVIVRINDRGPFIRNRIIDLSYAAAKRLGMVKHGVADVKIQVLGREVVDKKGTEMKKTLVEYIDVHKGEFTVQVGAFLNKKNAIKLAEKLKIIFPYVKINKFTDKNNRTLYRVHVSRSHTLEDAGKMKKKLRELGFEEAFIVRL